MANDADPVNALPLLALREKIGGQAITILWQLNILSYASFYIAPLNYSCGSKYNRDDIFRYTILSLHIKLNAFHSIIKVEKNDITTI